MIAECFAHISQDLFCTQTPRSSSVSCSEQDNIVTVSDDNEWH